MVPAVSTDPDRVLYMNSACENTRRLVAKSTLELSYTSTHMHVEAWPLAVALYNGIEQALKMLLLSPPSSAFALDDLRRAPYGHNLEKLYAALPSDDRDHIELHFREHWSLHDHDARGRFDATAEGFIQFINTGGSQGGSIAWRYTLLEGSSQIPSMNLWTMSEIWDAVCCRIRAKALGKLDDCLRISERLLYWLYDPVSVPMESYDGLSEDHWRWATHRKGDVLSAFVDLLVKASRDRVDQVQASEALRPELDKMATRAIEHMSSDIADPDEQRLLQRVRRIDRDLEWDPRQTEFRWADQASTRI